MRIAVVDFTRLAREVKGARIINRQLDDPADAFVVAVGNMKPQ